jgi:sugar phosphate isomerase/epimerase
VGDYLSDIIPLAALDEAVARLGETEIADGRLRTLWGGLELLFAEWSRGLLDVSEFAEALREFGPVGASTVVTTSVAIGSAHARDSAATSVHRMGIHLTQWIRFAQPSGTATGTGLVSQAVHPA